MNTTIQRKTLADSLRLVNEPDGFHYAIANFLDRFKSDPTSEMVSEEPPILRGLLKDKGFADAYAAAAAAHLCQLHGIAFPILGGPKITQDGVPMVRRQNPQP